MRHDPDILLPGEMRELETIKLALGCASMGMLVFGTLHTSNAAKTVDRIINTFPAEEQNQVRIMLGSCLAGVVAQLLCRRIPKGRCAVHEILLTHEALPNTIRSGQIANIKSIIESGSADGMVTKDNSLMARVKDGTIEAKEACMKAANKALFAPLLKPGDLDGGHWASNNSRSLNRSPFSRPELTIKIAGKRTISPHTCSTPVWKPGFGAGRPASSKARNSTCRVSCGCRIASTQPRAAP
jgi:hypothetical protein